ncbi:hypothetical protein DOT_3471 [Desulfosporosinus sp. OT]|nr:hypothetical protein DOT_3471 [Desulfosporosinus sp. OT]
MLHQIVITKERVKSAYLADFTLSFSQKIVIDLLGAKF